MRKSLPIVLNPEPSPSHTNILTLCLSLANEIAIPKQGNLKSIVRSYI